MKALSGFVLTGALFLLGTNGQAATITVAGVVKHQEDGKPAKDISIGIYFSKTSRTHDETTNEGRYRLVAESILDTVRFGWIVYDGTGYVATPVKVIIGAEKHLEAEPLYLISRRRYQPLPPDEIKEIEHAGARIAALVGYSRIRITLGIIDENEADDEVTNEVAYVGEDFQDPLSHERILKSVLRHLGPKGRPALSILEQKHFLNAMAASYDIEPPHEFRPRYTDPPRQ